MPAPLPPPNKKRDNQIDANEAKLIGDFFVTVGKELSSANRDLKTSVLEQADTGLPLDYYWVEEAEAEYKMGLTIGTKTEGAGRKRESEVVLKARYKRTGNPLPHAPFNVLAGVIAPAERNRKEILEALFSSTLVPEDRYKESLPIFHLGGNKYWVVEGANNYYVVELGAQATVLKINRLTELTSNLSEMFRFLESQLTGTISGSEAHD